MKKHLIKLLLVGGSLPLLAQRYGGRASDFTDAMDNAGMRKSGSNIGIGGYLIMCVLFIIGITLWVHFDNSNKK